MQATTYQYGGDGRRYSTPGVFFEDATPRRAPEFRTGVPVFVGYGRELHPPADWRQGKFYPYTLTGWAQFNELFGQTPGWGYLSDAVRGFFGNRGQQCVVIALPFHDEHRAPAVVPDEQTLNQVFDSVEVCEDVDLVCMPDLVLAGEGLIDLQKAVLRRCRTIPGLFAILDSLPPSPGTDGRQPQKGDFAGLLKQRFELRGEDGALYFPWVRARQSAHEWVPPCGHVAGIYSRTDAKYGVQKSPANEVVEGAVDLEVRLSDEEQGPLNDAGINCLRALPGRGIRVWGARTLIGLDDWLYVSVRRLFLTLIRWINGSFGDLVFEPYTAELWEKIQSRLNGFCYRMFQEGALNGVTASEAFYVRCNAETNPPEERDSGRVFAQVGLAAAAPAEFVVVRIAHSAAGATLVAPSELQERR